MKLAVITDTGETIVILDDFSPGELAKNLVIIRGILRNIEKPLRTLDLGSAKGRDVTKLREAGFKYDSGTDLWQRRAPFRSAKGSASIAIAVRRDDSACAVDEFKGRRPSVMKHGWSVSVSSVTRLLAMLRDHFVF